MSKLTSLEKLMNVMANENIHFEVSFEPCSEDCFLEVLIDNSVVFQTSDLIVELADIQGLVEQIYNEDKYEED